MSSVGQMNQRLSLLSRSARTGAGVFRGVGQVFFQENALTAHASRGDRAQLAADGLRRDSRRGDRNATAWLLKFDKAEARGDLRVQLGPGRNRHLFLLPPRRVSIGLLIGLRPGSARDPAHAAIRAVSDLHGAIHRYDLGTLLPGLALGAARGRARGRSPQPASRRPSPTVSARSCFRQASGRGCCS